ncbi:MAG: hypothetical protein LUF29_07800 [Oscillospiraceae bacterium]|nr:hypothetical protein [Oscillospiraceae bacterium]
MHKNICRRLICLVISVLMIMTLLPTSAFASVDVSTIKTFYVNGVDILSATDYTVACGSGTAVYDPDTNTLTLTDATITSSYVSSSSSYYGIYVYFNTAPTDPFTIKLVGENTLVGVDTSVAKYSYGIYCYKAELDITSDLDANDNYGGNLSSNGLYYPIIQGAGYAMSISNCEVSFTNTTYYCISALNGISIDNSTVTLNAVSNGSAVRGIVTGTTAVISITDSVVDISTSATSKASYCVYTSRSASSTSDSPIVVENSTLTCTNTNSSGSYPAIYANGITASGDSTTIVADGGVNFLSTKAYTHLTLAPEDGYEMNVSLGSSSSDAEVVDDYTSTSSTTFTETSALEYTTYTYFAITTEVSTGIKTYKVSVSDCTNGTVTASQTTRIEAGATVTLTVAADTDYQLDSLVVTDANGDEVTLTDNGDGTYSFTMPSSNVTVTATFGYADGILYIFKGADTFYFEFADYLDDYSAGDKLIITATISGNNSSFNGVLGASDDVSGYWSSTYYETGATTITLTVTVPDDYPDGGGQLQCYGVYYGDGFYLTSFSIAKAGSGKLSGVKATIYINEEYHGLLVTRNNRRFLISIPHDVDENGYCTVCKEYIGGEETVETVTLDDVEYAVEFSAELDASSGNWNKVTLGDAGFAEALNTEGAILVIERDTEMSLSYADGDYEKFIVGKDDSSWIALSTSGTTTDDEDGLVAYVSDDGTTVIYDGATVYAALSDAGLADLSSYVLISNTSGSYKIVSVKVLVPVAAE